MTAMRELNKLVAKYAKLVKVGNASRDLIARWHKCSPGRRVPAVGHGIDEYIRRLEAALKDLEE